MIEIKYLVVAIIVCFTVSCDKYMPDKNDLPSLQGLTEDPILLPTAQSGTPDTVSISNIRVSYSRAASHPKRLKRTRAQAKNRAQHLMRLARSKGQDFAELARQFSDDGTSSMDGGDLGVIERGQLHPNLEKAAFSLGIGQVAKVVESPHGFHVLVRHLPTEAQAAEILITYDGAHKYTPRMSRTPSQAETLANEIHARLKNGASFEEEVLTWSDHHTYIRGGFFPIFKKGTMLPKFEEIVWNLEVSQISEIVETSTGFHIVKRFPIKRVQIRRIDIKKPMEEQTGQLGVRTVLQANRLAHNILALVKKGEEDFASLAALHSEGSTKTKGGSAEPFGKGEGIPYKIEKAAFALDLDQISKIIETRKGLHIIKRIR